MIGAAIEAIPAPYLVAVLGSIGVELAAALAHMKAREGTLPPPYRQPNYIALHLLFALVAAGPLPLILKTGSLASAFYVGASAPVIYDKVSRGVHPDFNSF